MSRSVLASMSQYSTIQRAVANPVKAKDVVNHLTQSRTLCLAVLFGLFASVCGWLRAATMLTSYSRFHVQSKRAADEVYVLTAILLTLCIGAMYDGLDEQAFKARITSLGVLGFTITNAIPNISVAALLLRALTLISHSPALLVAQIAIVILPVMVQLICELVAMRLMGQAGDTAVELGETVTGSATQTVESALLVASRWMQFVSTGLAEVQDLERGLTHLDMPRVCILSTPKNETNKVRVEGLRRRAYEHVSTPGGSVRRNMPKWKRVEHERSRAMVQKGGKGKGLIFKRNETDLGSDFGAHTTAKDSGSIHWKLAWVDRHKIPL
ncbi:hypothetical protein DFH09DRAFT_1101246 [Mycena vulgaris]|nr:hypothetical protein DFH09DRAFT_1101246 [Mycena vulgaris]